MTEEQNTKNIEEILRSKAEELERLRKEHNLLSVNFMLRKGATMSDSEYMDYTLDAVKEFVRLLGEDKKDQLERHGF